MSRFLGRFGHDRRGNYSMIVVLLLPVLTGFVGVGTEAGLWLYDQQSEQTAADAAAFSAAAYYQTQSPVSGGNQVMAGQNGQTQALAVAANYGFTGTPQCTTANGVTTCTAPSGCNVNGPSTGSSCVAVNNPPLAGAQVGNNAAFEVIISQSPQQLFSRLLMSNPVVIKARTVGVVNATTQQVTTQTTTSAPCSGTACVCIKVANATNVANSANFSGTAALNLLGCSLEVDDPNSAALNLSGTTTVSATNVYLANTMLQYSVNGSTCTTSNQAANPCSAVTATLAATPVGGFADPYQAQLQNAKFSDGTPAIPIIMTGGLGGCQSATVALGVGGTTIGPTNDGTIYFKQIHITGSTTLRPGTYYVCPGGNVSISGSTSVIVSTAPFPLPTGCTSPYANCNGSVPYMSGDGVTIVLLGTTAADGSVSNCAYFNLSGGSSVQLVPPNSGPFAGIVLTSSLNCTPPAVGTSGNQAGTATIAGGTSTQFFGAVDLPDYSITYSGTSSLGNSGCLNIIANSFAVAGTASLTNNCTGVGTSSIGQQTTTTSSSTTSSQTVYQAALSN